MPLGSFGNVPGANPSPQELSDAFARLLKEVDYLLNGGLDTLNVNELSADVINAGVLNALLVVIKGLSGGKFFQIDANGIVANNGTVDTMKFDLTTGLLTLVSVLIQSATGYPKIEFNSLDNILAAYSSATDRIKLLPVYSSGPPALLFDIADATRAIISLIAGSFTLSTSGSTNLNLQSAQDINLSCNGLLKIDNLTGFTGTFEVVSSVNFVAQTVTYTRVTVRKGIITNVAAV